MLKNKFLLQILIVALSLITINAVSGKVYAACSTTGAGGTLNATGGGSQTDGSAGNAGSSACLSGGGAGGMGGGGANGGAGGNGSGGGVIIKNTSGTMSISGTIDVRGGNSSTTNGGTVKLFYTGSAPSTAGVSSGRTYTASATTQNSATCIPSSIADNASTGTAAWSPVGAASTEDGLTATAAGSNTTTHYLVLTGCNLAIPSNATITGIRADFLRYADTGAVSDNAIRLVKGGAIQTTDRSGVSWSGIAGPAWSTYGGATDLWGSTLTSSDVNASNFGIALSATLGNLAGADIDVAHITVYFTTSVANTAPAAPTLLAPLSGATGQSITPAFQLRTTDADNDYLQYKIIIYNSDCSTNPQTFDESVSQTGWSGQDQQTGTAYTGSSTLTSSTIANFAGATLSNSTTYCWQAAAKDPGGTNTFGSLSATQLFTTQAPSIPVNIRGGTTIKDGVTIH